MGALAGAVGAVAGAAIGAAIEARYDISPAVYNIPAELYLMQRVIYLFFDTP